MKRRFFFGQPVLPAKPVADGPRSVFVLGAYPSALHVQWRRPEGGLLIKAVAVDNEPEPFWTGDDERERINSWLDAVGFRDEWGRVEPCGSLNGSSGAWVHSNVLEQLSVLRNDAWITDCLDTYFESETARNRLDSKSVKPFVELLGIPSRYHLQHPSESEIVRMGLAEHRERSTTELKIARPQRVVTLGNAALRVFRDLVDSAESSIRKLSVESYGEPIEVKISGRSIEWIPLAHPAAPAIYQDAHEKWVSGRKRSG